MVPMHLLVAVCTLPDLDELTSWAFSPITKIDFFFYSRTIIRGDDLLIVLGAFAL